MNIILGPAQLKTLREFIYADIEREIQLAKADKDELRKLGINPGGGNVLVALGLLCYTEFAGKLVTKQKPFDAFLKRMGTDYEKLVDEQHLDIWGELRSGLVHSYAVESGCTVNMPGENLPGLQYGKSGYVFNVASYFRDFKKAFDALVKT